MRPLKSLAITCLLLATAVHAATPPEVINYQGVLRDAEGNPLDGNYEMMFRFWSAETGGDEILIDEFIWGFGNVVTVTGGLFSVPLGGGYVNDGSGPGTYTALADVFRDYTQVWIDVEIAGQILSPRVRVRSAGYALNASNLDGRDASEFIDTSSSAQVKNGQLRIETTYSDYAIDVSGTYAAGRFRDTDDGSEVIVATGGTGINASGTLQAGLFSLLDGSAIARLAFNGEGAHASGNLRGGYFENNITLSNGRLGTTDYGVEGHGPVAGGLFTAFQASGYGYVGRGHTGVEGYGAERGGYFQETDATGRAILAADNTGVEGHGSEAGGYFTNSGATGEAWVGYGDWGVYSLGDLMGGYFKDGNNSGYSYVGYGNYGVQSFGTDSGGYFEDSDDSGLAYLGYGDGGIEASGNFWGGHFVNTGAGASGEAYLALYSNGINAWGEDAGGVFLQTGGSGLAYVARTDFGIDASGEYQAFRQGGGGRFEDTLYTGVAYVGHGNEGIYAEGSFTGGEFKDTDSGNYGRVGYSSYKVWGTGTVSFVQNHPADQSKVIVYHAPEASEVAVYTRGSGRLDNGVARVVLDETFQWTANPDLGLTAHLTPRDHVASPLVADSVSTTELVVYGPDGSDASFDYLVYGLRIGFEESSVVQPKEREAYLPSMQDHQDNLLAEPALREFTAKARFEQIETGVRGRSVAESTRAAELAARIGRFDPEIHLDEYSRNNVTAADVARVSTNRAEPDDVATAPTRAGINPDVVSAIGGDSTQRLDEQPPVDGRTILEVNGTFEPGDVLALDPDRPGFLRHASEMADPTVFGIVLEALPDGRAVVGTRDLVEVHVDAGYGAIRPGDLLVSSPTPGHAMSAIEILPGTVLGKALDGLETGKGTIRVLVTLR